MTLSRRDEFAARAMVMLFQRSGYFEEENSRLSASYADALIAELDRTAPKPNVAALVDDGREIRCVVDEVPANATVSDVYPRTVYVNSDCWLTPEDAIIFAHRIIKAAEEARNP